MGLLKRQTTSRKDAATAPVVHIQNWKHETTLLTAKDVEKANGVLLSVSRKNRRVSIAVPANTEEIKWVPMQKVRAQSVAKEGI